MRKFALAFTLVLIGLLVIINAVYAPWSTLGTGYAITSNVHGIDILPGTPVTVTAGTLDTNVVQVTFRWHRPDETVAREVTIPVFQNGTKFTFKNGTKVLIYYALDTYASPPTPESIGEWGVQAFFQDSMGKDRAGLEDVIKIKAISFNTVSEVPFGTIVTLLSMFGALSIFAIRKRHVTASNMKA